MYKGLLPKKYQDGGPLRTHPYAKTLQDGGRTTEDEYLKAFKLDVEKDLPFKERARMSYYKTILDAELAKKNPQKYAEIVKQYNRNTPVADRTAAADRLVESGEYDYALDLDDIKNILGDQYNDFNTLRTKYAADYGSTVAGEAEGGTSTGMTRYGLRNSWATPVPIWDRSYDSNPSIEDTVEASYDPATRSYSYKYNRRTKSEDEVNEYKKQIAEKLAKKRAQDAYKESWNEFNRPPRAGSRKDGGTLPAMPTKKDSPTNIKERFDVTKAKDPKVIAGVPKKLIGEKDGYKIYEVDDDYVKVNLYEDFTEGGNPEAYPEFVPKGEIWVASDKTPQNIADIVDHELVEAKLMQGGMKYDEAHVKANKDEMNRRVAERPGLLVTKKSFKKGGKVGNPKDRSKPGGSNVGKYSKSEGPFAGPSGGAPAGSYPIGSKARGKSALKLAHNAPNPAGIKKAVYRKYPDLKPSKAARGSKLGMNETGVLQGSYPAAPPARRYLLVKKDKPHYTDRPRRVKK